MKRSERQRRSADERSEFTAEAGGVYSFRREVCRRRSMVSPGRRGELFSSGGDSEDVDWIAADGGRSGLLRGDQAIGGEGLARSSESAPGRTLESSDMTRRCCPPDRFPSTQTATAASRGRADSPRAETLRIAVSTARMPAIR